MLWLFFLLIVLLRAEVPLKLQNHVAVADMAFVYFTPAQILPGSTASTHNASAICRILPSPSRDLEDHAIICFSNMEQYGVRFSNETRLSCIVEHLQGTVDVAIETPVLQNSCVLHPVLLPFDHGDQAAQSELFAHSHDDVCRTSPATMRSCRSIDNHTFLDLLTVYHFGGDQIILVEHARRTSEFVLDLVVDFVKYYWHKS